MEDPPAGQPQPGRGLVERRIETSRTFAALERPPMMKGLVAIICGLLPPLIITVLVGQLTNNANDSCISCGLLLIASLGAGVGMAFAVYYLLARKQSR